MGSYERNESPGRTSEQNHYGQPAVRSPVFLVHDSLRPEHRGSNVDDSLPPLATNDGLHPVRVELVVHGGSGVCGAGGRPVWRVDRDGGGLGGLGSLDDRSAACRNGGIFVPVARDFWLGTYDVDPGGSERNLAWI